MDLSGQVLPHKQLQVSWQLSLITCLLIVNVLRQCMRMPLYHQLNAAGTPAWAAPLTRSVRKGHKRVTMCLHMQSMLRTRQAFSCLTWQWAHRQPTRAPASMVLETFTPAASFQTREALAMLPCPLSMRLSSREALFEC